MSREYTIRFTSTLPPENKKILFYLVMTIHDDQMIPADIQKHIKDHFNKWKRSLTKTDATAPPTDLKEQTQSSFNYLTQKMDSLNIKVTKIYSTVNDEESDVYTVTATNSSPNVTTSASDSFPPRQIKFFTIGEERAKQVGEPEQPLREEHKTLLDKFYEKYLADRNRYFNFFGLKKPTNWLQVLDHALTRNKSLWTRLLSGGRSRSTRVLIDMNLISLVGDTMTVSSLATLREKHQGKDLRPFLNAAVVASSRGPRR